MLSRATRSGGRRRGDGKGQGEELSLWAEKHANKSS